VKALHATVLSGSVRGGELMIDAMFSAPVGHGFGSKFTVVGDENFEFMTGLVFDHAMPSAKDGGSFRFKFKG
jgi:hypothetical protein